MASHRAVHPYAVPQTLGFVVGEHDFIVDSNKCKVTTEKDDIAKQPLIGFDHTNTRRTAKARGLPISLSLSLRTGQVIQ